MYWNFEFAIFKIRNNLIGYSYVTHKKLELFVEIFNFLVKLFDFLRIKPLRCSSKLYLLVVCRVSPIY